MSMINDALRRARQAQTQTPPPKLADSPTAEPAFRPPVTPGESERRSPWPVVGCVVAVVLLVLGLRWSWNTEVEVDSATVRARAATPAQASATETTAAAAETPALAPDQTPSAPAAPAVETLSLEAPPAVAPAKPRLQGIIYDPKRPSAMIDGEVVFAGDTIRGLRVIKVSPTGVTLEGPEGKLELAL